MNEGSSQLPVDDLRLGQFFTILRNKDRCGPHPDAPESRYLKGTVLKVKSISLPYVFVKAADPQYGCWSSIIDVRKHLLGRVSDDFAHKVWKHCKSQSTESDSHEKLGNGLQNGRHGHLDGRRER